MEKKLVEVEKLDNSRALSELSSILQEYKSEWMFQLWVGVCKSKGDVGQAHTLRL